MLHVGRGVHWCAVFKTEHPMWVNGLHRAPFIAVHGLHVPMPDEGWSW